MLERAVQPDRKARPEYVDAFRELAQRIVTSLATVSRRTLPIKMYVAGGAAVHLYTGARVSKDVDAAFSHRIALPEDLEVAYRDADGRARMLFFDRSYNNDTFALMHEDARDDSRPLELSGIDADILDIRLLSPTDLAVSKLARFSEQDRDDVVALARNRLIDSASLRKRAEEALVAYVGETSRLRTSIDIACRLVDEERRAGKAAR
jgi:hypothetical protein